MPVGIGSAVCTLTDSPSSPPASLHVCTRLWRSRLISGRVHATSLLHTNSSVCGFNITTPSGPQPRRLRCSLGYSSCTRDRTALYIEGDVRVRVHPTTRGTSVEVLVPSAVHRPSPSLRRLRSLTPVPPSLALAPSLGNFSLLSVEGSTTPLLTVGLLVCFHAHSAVRVRSAISA